MRQLTCKLLGCYERLPLDVILVLARVIIGLVFFRSGLTKIEGMALKESTFFLFAMEYQLPLISPVVAAYMATLAELTMPVLLWLGLATRLAATALLLMTLVIQIFVYPDAFVTHGLWAIALLILMRFGAGTVALDRLVAKVPAVPPEENG